MRRLVFSASFAGLAALTSLVLVAADDKPAAERGRTGTSSRDGNLRLPGPPQTIPIESDSTLSADGGAEAAAGETKATDEAKPAADAKAADAPAEPKPPEPKPAPAAEPNPAERKPANGAPHASPVDMTVDLRKQIEELRSELAEARSEIARLDAKYAKAVIATNDAVEKFGKEVESLQTAQKALDEKLEASSKSLNDLTRQVSKNNADLLYIVEQVAEEETPLAGNWRVKVNALSDKNGKPRQDIIRVLQGRLLLENSGEERIIYVNGTPWRAIRGRSFIWVPVGTVTIATEGGIEPRSFSEWESNKENKLLEMKYKF